MSEARRICCANALAVWASTCAWLAYPTHAEDVAGPRAPDEQHGGDWVSYGRTDSEAHYSPLHGIDTANVKALGLAWSLDLPGQRTLEGTPLAVAGVLYFSGTYGKTYAVEADSGRLLWEFDPELAQHAPQKLRMNMGAHRGVAYWKGSVYVGVHDGRLVRLDARTGKVLWSVQTFDAPAARKWISGAPRVFNGSVIIGHGGADFGTRGYVTAYDARTGRQRWRFYTVPGDPQKGFESKAMAMAAETWQGQWWHWGGGGTVWDNITYDPEFNRIYIGVGNGGPNNAAIRSPGGGDNLFLCSIVALEADTGQYAWHYQINPRESWDYKATANMVMAELTLAGKPRKVLMQAPSNGFFYVIDRASGKLISAEKFAKATWAERIDLRTGRPVEAPGIRYEHGPVDIWPASFGAHGWQPMSFNPRTGLVYIPTTKLGMRIAASASMEDMRNFDDAQRRYFAIWGYQVEPAPMNADDGTGALLAWDPVAQRKRWEVRYDTLWNGGTLTTAGNLVFQGTGRGRFIAYDATTGESLWSFDAGLGIIGAPITFEVSGQQYVSILVGYGGAAGMGTALFDYGWRFNRQPRRLLTFALGKRGALPPNVVSSPALAAVDDPALAIDEAEVAEGFKLYHSTCHLCHGMGVESTGSIAPDLRESPLALSWRAFDSVLREGLLSAVGMPKYDDLSERDRRAIFAYVRHRAREALHPHPDNAK